MLVPLVCLFLPLAACSDDDGGKDKDKAGDEPTSVLPTDPQELRKRIPKTVKCDAEVTTSGAYDHEWSGDAQVRTGGKSEDDTGPNAVYELKEDGNRVALYSPGPEFKGSISLSAEGLAFSSDPADAESFDIDKRGKHAQVDTTLTSISGQELQLVAEFTCGKQKSK
jgi:hypothetical protein